MHLVYFLLTPSNKQNIHIKSLVTNIYIHVSALKIQAGNYVSFFNCISLKLKENVRYLCMKLLESQHHVRVHEFIHGLHASLFFICEVHFGAFSFKSRVTIVVHLHTILEVLDIIAVHFCFQVLHKC